MKKTILILEDNAERIEAIQAWLLDRLYMFSVEFFDDPVPMIQRLNDIADDVLAVSLDHDLNEADRDRSTSADPTGMDVVNHLLTRKPTFPILVHSTNSTEAPKMARRLKKQRWVVSRVIPFDDTTWIGTEWLPALRQLIEQCYTENLATTT